MNFSVLWRSLPGKLAILTALICAGCNLFNPDGTGEVGENADALLIEAQNRYRDAEYTKAYELFQKVVALDSNRSEGYFGMAKAGMRMRGVNPMNLLQYVNVDSNEVPFMNSTNTDKNTYYRGMRLVDSVLAPLAHRDTLTALYEWHLRATTEADFINTLSENDRQKLLRFREQYASSGYAGFPLSDRRVAYEKFSVGLTIARMVRELLGFLDINKDGSIDDKDLNISIGKDANGNITVDVENLYTQALNDPAVIDQLNSSIDSLQYGMDGLEVLIENLGGAYGLADSDTANNAMTEEVQSATEEQLNSLQGAIQFYKIGDRRDNDGDGCVDEEILDSLDNDGDGRKDEDLRIAALTGPTAYIDGIDNDQDGIIDESDEVPVGERDMEVGTHFMGFYSGFVPNFQGRPNTDSLLLKIEVAQDTSSTAYRFDRTQRRELIGGCWTNYNDFRFLNWFPNR